LQVRNILLSARNGATGSRCETARSGDASQDDSFKGRSLCRRDSNMNFCSTRRNSTEFQAPA
jgi:hypothetical protein